MTLRKYALITSIMIALGILVYMMTIGPDSPPMNQQQIEATPLPWWTWAE